MNISMKKLIKKIKKNQLTSIVIVVSILVLIMGIFTVGPIVSALIVGLLDAIYFVPNVLKKRKKRNSKTATKSNSKKRKVNKKTIFEVILLIGFIGTIICILAMSLFFAYIVKNNPGFDPDALYTTEPTIIYDKDGNEIARIGSEQRIILTYDELPEVLVNAIVATEDSKFFKHNGVDIGRFLVASVYQLLGKDAGGASTLTMQVSKNDYTDTNSSGFSGIIRKFTDVYLSVFKIEPTYTKEQILEFYVNRYFLGGGYGVEQTSLTYFGKSAKDLNLSEAAMIAGLFQAPGKYDPYSNPEGTEKRRKLVLYYMHRHGYISDAEYDIAVQMTVDKIVVPEGTTAEVDTESTNYQSFIDAVVYEIRDKYDIDPYTTSMKIYTTMDSEKQEYVSKIMYGETYEWENDLVQAGVAVVDVNTGAVVALGGSRQKGKLLNNRAISLCNQIGSTAKPLYDYGPAIEFLNWSTYNILVDEPSSYSNGTSINNWDGKFQGFETMRYALTMSRNIPALKTFKLLNKENIVSFVEGLGLSPDLSQGDLFEAHSIGGYNGESPLTMAAAYAAFANGGYYTEPYLYTKIVLTDTNEEITNISAKQKAMSEETAYMMTSMLIDTAKHALSYYSSVFGYQFAAKTGTTNHTAKTLADNGLPAKAVNDLWVVGYNPEYSIGVWYGYDYINSDYYNVLSSNQHSRLFQAIAKGMFTNVTWTQPENVVSVTLEYGCPTACLPSEYTPESFKTTELFISGTEPTAVSTRFAQLDDVTNLKAASTEDGIKLTWTAIDTPDSLDQQYLKNYYSSVFENQGKLNEYVTSVYNTNVKTFGSVGYNVYLKTDTGLELLGFTTDPEYTVTDKTGDLSFVVKTTYSSFSSNMSKGKTVTITSTSTSSDKN